ncbi:MAG: hypothetical protein JSV25_09780 [Spirochaetota bacterium]|nr:MAG: hypothetical protein JSV25_09780 [Spirochaetota bacterium]
MKLRWGKMLNDLNSIDKIASEGFDCVQLTIDLIMKLNEEEFTHKKEYLLQTGLLFEVFTEPLPPEVFVTQKGFNVYVWTVYLKKALHRIAELGCRKLCWSNGKARILPEEGEIMDVKEQFMQFLFMLCEMVENYGITILIEPLGPKQTNFLNTMEEIKDLLPLINKNNLSSMISLRELGQINLDIKNIEYYKEIIKHVQMENPLSDYATRISPRPEDDYDYHPFLNTLRSMNYSEIITLPQDADKEVLDYCYKLWNE